MSEHCSNLHHHFKICILLHENVSSELFIKSVKVASNSEKQSLLQLDPRFMSSEEDEEGSQAQLWIVKVSEIAMLTVNILLKKLQGKIEWQYDSSCQRTAGYIENQARVLHQTSS